MARRRQSPCGRLRSRGRLAGARTEPWNTPQASRYLASSCAQDRVERNSSAVVTAAGRRSPHLNTSFDARLATRHICRSALAEALGIGHYALANPTGGQLMTSDQRDVTDTVLRSVREFLGGPTPDGDEWCFEFGEHLQSNWGAVYGGALAAGALTVARLAVRDRSPR